MAVRLRGRPVVLVVVSGLVAGVLVAAPTHPVVGSAFPGGNGLVAYTSSWGGNADIYVIEADGGGKARLTENHGVDHRPSWSADGSFIAYCSDVGGNHDVFVMNADGTGKSRLTTDAAEDWGPSWSPDGSRIAYVSNRDGDEEIYVMNADGSEQSRLTTSVDWGPSWSPDGSQIAFTSLRYGGPEIVVMAADGSSPRRLTTSGAGESLEPTWSPDGSRIAFAHRLAGSGQFDIWTMAADGSQQASLVSSPFDDLEPAWAPDGTRIAFTRATDDEGNPGQLQNDIWVVAADGTDVTRLTSDGHSQLPSWQPNTPPVGVNDTAVTDEEAPVAIDVLANDMDADHDVLRVIEVGAAGAGRTELTAEGTVRYQPDLDFVGTDTFTYSLGDGDGGTASASVAVTVTDVVEGGVLDGSFGTSGVVADPWWEDGITAVAPGPGGTIVAAGPVLDATGTKVFGVARYDIAGNLDPTFSGDGRATAGAGDLGGIAYAVAVSDDGTTLVAGKTVTACPTPYYTPRGCGAFARFLPDGTLDPSFGGDGIVIPPADDLWATAVHDVALLPGGRIIAVGVESNPDVDATAVFRLTSDGSLEDLDGDGVGDVVRPDYCHDSQGECTSAPAAWSDRGTSVALQPDGKVVVAGLAESFSTDAWELTLARFNPDLTPDLSFGDRGTRITAVPGNAEIGSEEGSARVALQPDGSLVIAAFRSVWVGSGSRAGRIVLARHTADGALAPGGLQVLPFGAESGAVGELALDAEGRALIAGTLLGGPPDYSYDFALRRFLPDGSVDATFDGGTVTGAGFGGTDATDLLVWPDGAILAAGRGYDVAADLVIGVLIRIAASAADGDGVPDAEEDSGPNGGDGNADGVADSSQDNVATLRSAGAGTPYLTLASPPGTVLVGVAAGPTPPTAPPGIFPLGALSFTVVGVGPDPVPVDVLYPGVSVNSWFKYQGGAWLPFAAHFTSLGPDHGRLTLQDGGPGDQGPAGDGEITDPSVPALVDIDTGPPVTTATLSGSAGMNGWYRSPVVIDLHATDDTGVASITYAATGATVVGETTVPGETAQVTVSAEGTTTVEFAATDSAGNAEAAQTLEVRVDTTAPDVVCAVPGQDWSATDVAVSCVATDSTSGLADPGDANFALTTSVPAGVETADAQTGTRAVGDVAGNTATAGPIGGVRVDKKAPVVSLTTPAEGDTFAQGAVVVPVYGCGDGASGVAACSGPTSVNTNAPGHQTFTVIATDAVGNTTTVTHAYTVTAGGGTADTVAITLTGAIAFEAAGSLTSGDFQVSLDASGVVAVSGTGRTGSTVVSLWVHRFLWTSVHTGWVRVSDPSVGLAVTTPLMLVPVRPAGATGATATSTWITSGRPARGYRLTWRIDDLR